MKRTRHAPRAALLRRLAPLLLAGLLLVLGGGSGPGRAAASSQAHHTPLQAHALHPQTHGIEWVGTPPVLGGAVATSASNVHLFVDTLGTPPLFDQWNGSQWSGWSDEGNIVPDPNPIALTQDDEGPWVFMRSSYSSQIWVGSIGYGSGDLPGFPVTSAPAAVSWGGSRLDVIAWGTPFNIPVLLHDASNDNGTTWLSDGLPYLLNADPTLQPTIVSRGVNRLDILALGTDHALYYLSWNGSTWGQWQSLGGSLLYGHVAAVPMSATQLEVYGIGSDGGLYQQVLTGSSWSGWQSLGGSLIQSAPTVVAWNGVNRTVCLLGGDNALWCVDGHGTPTTWSWYSLGGAFVSSVHAWFRQKITAATPPISVALDQNDIEVFAIDAAGAIWANVAGGFTYLGYRILLWQGWHSLGPAVHPV